MRFFLIPALLLFLSSCFTKTSPRPKPYIWKKEWAYKPIYEDAAIAKQIRYIDSALPVKNPGNIYAKDNLIYQLELGRGVHIIDNAVPSQAHRVGFIVINGSSQISIKGNFLYSNSYEDLVVVDVSNGNSVTEAGRVANAYPQGRYEYYYLEPPEAGYYQCPSYDSVVIGWKKDSVYAGCYKN